MASFDPCSHHIIAAKSPNSQTLLNRSFFPLTFDEQEYN